MIFPFPDTILLSQVRLAEERFRLLVADPGSLSSTVAAGLVRQGSPNPNEKAALVGQGLFSIELFQAMMSGGGEYRLGGLNLIWERLVSAGLVVRIFIHLPGAFADHMIDRQKLASHLQDDTFANLFWPVSSPVNRYAASVIAIDVVKAGTPYQSPG